MADRTRGEYWAQEFVALIKRSAFRFGVLLGLIVFEILIFLVLALMAFLVEKLPESFRDVAAILVVLAFFAIHLLFWFFAVYPPKKWRNRWMEKDAERWLREKHATGYRPSPFVRRMVRRTIWAPVLLAALVFLFLPDLLGVWSQRHCSRPVVVSGFTIRAPRTWIFWRHGDYVDLIILKGAGGGNIRDWWDLNPPIASLSVESLTKKSYANPEQAKFLRTIRNGSLELRCWQHPLHYQALLIDCTAENGELTASFYGSEIYLQDFYAAIEN